MNVTTESLPNCQVALVIQPDEGQVEDAMRAAARKIGKRYRVPGFRPGKAPYAAVVRAYGKEALLEQVAEDLLDQVYQGALEETGLEPIAQPDLEDITLEPLAYRLIVSLPPVVDLGDYRSIRVERSAVEVTDEDVAARLQELRESQAEWVPVESGGAQYADRLVFNIHGFVDADDVIIDDDAVELVLDEESEGFPPGFDAHFVGLQAGDAFDFELQYPEDWPSQRAGATAHYSGEIVSVSRYQEPELDELVALVGDFDSVDALRESIREGFRNERQAEADNRYANEVLGAFVEGATRIEFPPVLVQQQAEYMVEEQTRELERAGLPLEDFLRITRQSRDQYMERIGESARAHIAGDLVLDKLAELEGLEASLDEIEAELARFREEAEDEAGLAGLLESESGRRALGHELTRRRTIARMIAIAEGVAPPPADPDAAQPDNSGDGADASEEAAAAETADETDSQAEPAD